MTYYEKAFHKINMFFSNSVQNNPVQNTPIQNTPVQNTPVQNTPVQNTPVQNTSVSMGNIFSTIKSMAGKGCGSCGGK